MPNYSDETIADALDGIQRRRYDLPASSANSYGALTESAPCSAHFFIGVSRKTTPTITAGTTSSSTVKISVVNVVSDRDQDHCSVDVVPGESERQGARQRGTAGEIVPQASSSLCMFSRFKVSARKPASEPVPHIRSYKSPARRAGTAFHPL